MLKLMIMTDNRAIESRDYSRVRTRLAPSPTGRIHVGSIQKIIYSYACAKKFGGDYLLRIEDTDRARFVESAEAEIYQVHDALGIHLDESPRNPNPKYGSYRQSERKEIYAKYARQLVELGHAYYAFETPEELEAMRKVQQIEGRSSFRYSGPYRELSLTEADAKIAQGMKYVVRIKLPIAEDISFTDMIMGKITVNSANLDDYVLLKSDGLPTYHLAVVVDDHLMEISHIFRGVEWIATAPIHVMLYKYFDWPLPNIAHIPNILDPKGGKLSKRSGSVAAMDFLANGFLPEAIINYLLLQSWNPKTTKELYTLSEFVEDFDINKFNKGNPIYNPVKLTWFNQQHLKLLELPELLQRLKNWEASYHPKSFPTSNKLWAKSDVELIQMIELERERVEGLLDLRQKLDMFVSQPDSYEFEHKQLKKLTSEQLQQIIEEYSKFLNASGNVSNNSDYNHDYNHEVWESTVRAIAENLAIPAGAAFMAIRIALTGQAATPPLYELGKLLGTTEQLSRLQKASSLLKA